MATESELSAALINADKAGDTEAAKMLAAEIVRVRGQSLGGQSAQPNTQMELPFADKAMKFGKDLTYSVASGATGNYFDELAAKVSEMRGVGTYDENMKAVRKRMEEIGPATRIPGEVLGGIGSAVAVAPAAAGTKVAQMYARLPPWLQSTGLGALFGGLYGSGAAEEGERMKGAAVGAPLGAATGLATHGVLKGAEAALGGVAKGIRTLRNPEEAAIRKVADAFNLDETTAGRVQARLNTLGPQGMIADAGGENVLGTLRGAAGVPGVAKNRVMMSLKGRAEGEAGRISQATKMGLNPQDYFAAEDAFLGKLQGPAKQVYQAAYEANPSVMTDKLSGLLKRPVMQGALKEAAELAGIEGSNLGPVSKELTEAARFASEVGKMKPIGKVSEGYSLETWDNIKRGLDSMIEKESNEITGRLTNRGRLLSNLKNELTSALDTATGGDRSLYAQARKQYAGDIEVLKALRDGKDFMKLAPERIARKLGEYSESAKEAYRSGAARAIADIAANVPDQASAAQRLFGKAITRDKIRAIFPDQKSAHEFARKMAAERRFAETKNYVGSGSRTAPMLAEQQNIADALGSVGATMASKIPGGHPFIMAKIGRKLINQAFPQSQEAQMAIARILTTRNPAERLFYLDKLRGLNIGTPPSGSLDPWTASMIMGLTGQEGRMIGQNQRP